MLYHLMQYFGDAIPGSNVFTISPSEPVVLS